MKWDFVSRNDLLERFPPLLEFSPTSYRPICWRKLQQRRKGKIERRGGLTHSGTAPRG
jgi:hypothetical protein